MTVDAGLRPLFRQYLAPLGFDMQSIETGGTGRGVPDTNYCVRTNRGDYGVEGWIEFKYTDGWAVTLRPEQIGWIARRVRAGGRVFVAVRRRHDGGSRRGVSVDELYLLPGSHARQARVGGLRSPEVIAVSRMWPGGPARWNWHEIGEFLVS